MPLNVSVTAFCLCLLVCVKHGLTGRTHKNSSLNKIFLKGGSRKNTNFLLKPFKQGNDLDLGLPDFLFLLCLTRVIEQN